MEDNVGVVEIEKMLKPEYRGDGDKIMEALGRFFKSKMFLGYVVGMSGCWVILLLLYVFFFLDWLVIKIEKLIYYKVTICYYGKSSKNSG